VRCRPDPAKKLLSQNFTVVKQRYPFENDSNYQKSSNGGLHNYRSVSQNLKSVSRSELSVFERILCCLSNEEFESWMRVFHLYTEGVLCQDELFLLSEEILTAEKVPEELILGFKVLVNNREVGRKINSVLCKATSELE
jgi:histone deacetylase complex regulatory component SIN3